MLYLTKNGQQLGPYPTSEVQNLVRAGTVKLTDLAWHEGIPNWIPLHQVAGFSAVPPAPPVPAATSTGSQFERQAPVKKSLLQKIGGGVAAVAYAAFKFKFLIFGALKTGLSMLLMIWIYARSFGWPFAVGFVLLIFVHEMGHVAAAKWKGLPVSAPLFIPFVGAMIMLKENPRDAWTEAIIGYGGPLAGCIGSWICWAAAIYLQADWLMAIAASSFLMNLFNMIPVPPLDGGRICAAVSPWFWLIGIVLLGAALVYFHSWRSFIVLGVIFVIATLPRLKATFQGRNSPELQSYYATRVGDRLIMALMYLGLIAALLLGYWDASNHLYYLWKVGATPA